MDQVRDLWRKLEKMQEEADRERSEKQALRQDNERLQRQVDELMVIAASASETVNGDRQTIRSSTVPSSPESPCNGVPVANDRQSVDLPTAPRPPKSLCLQVPVMIQEHEDIGQLVQLPGPEPAKLEDGRSLALAGGAPLPAPPLEAAHATIRSGSAVVPSTGTSPRSPRDSSLPGPRISASGRRSIQVPSGEPVRRTWPTVAGRAVGLGAGLGAAGAAVRGVAVAPRGGAEVPVCAMTPQPRR